MLGNIAEDQIGRDWRHLIEPGLADFALNIIFLGKAKTAIGLHADFSGRPSRIGTEQFCQIGLFAGVFASFIKTDRFSQH